MRLGSRRTLALAFALLVAVAGAAGWIALVQPQRAEARRLAGEAAAVNAEIAARRALLLRARRAQLVDRRELAAFRRAMPRTLEMPSILLELSRLAAESGITFRSIAPRQPEPVSGYSRVPIELTYGGSFRGLAGFLARLDARVAVHGGSLDAAGRLYSLETLRFDEGERGFPQIDASLVVDAFVFDGAAAAPAAAPAAAEATP